MPDRLCAVARKRNGEKSEEEKKKKKRSLNSCLAGQFKVSVLKSKGACGDVYQVGSQRKGTESELGSYLWVLLALLWVSGIQMIFFFFFFLSFKHGTAHRNNDEADTEKHN